MLPFWVRVYLGAMAIKRYTAFSKAPASPSDGLVSYPEHSLVGSLTPLHRCIQCILQLQSTWSFNVGQQIQNKVLTIKKSTPGKKNEIRTLCGCSTCFTLAVNKIIEIKIQYTYLESINIFHHTPLCISLLNEFPYSSHCINWKFFCWKHVSF